MTAPVELTIEQMREARRQAIASSSASHSSHSQQAHGNQQQQGLLPMDEDTIESINTLIRDAPKNARLFYTHLLREVCLYSPDENFTLNPVSYIKTLPPYTWLRVRGPVIENGGRHWILAVFDKISPQSQQQQSTHVSDDWFKIQEFFVLVKDDKGKVNMSRPVMEAPSSAFDKDANAFSLERFMEKPTMPDIVQPHKVDYTNATVVEGAHRKNRSGSGKKKSSGDDDDDDDSSSDDEETAAAIALAKKKGKKKKTKSVKKKRHDSDDEGDEEDEEDEDNEETPSGWFSWLPRFGSQRE